MQPSFFLHRTRRCVVDGASHSATFLRSLWFHRYVTRCLVRTWTAAAWFITLGRSQEVLPSVMPSFYRERGLRKGYWGVYEYLSLLPSSTVRNSTRCAPRMSQRGKRRNDPRATCNLCLILKIVLQNHVIGITSHKTFCNCIYVHKNINTGSMTHSLNLNRKV